MSYTYLLALGEESSAESFADITPEAVGQAVQQVRKAAGILKRITPHTLRSAYATHSLRIPGNDIDLVQKNLRHSDVRTTLGYIGADGAEGISPLDFPMSSPAGRANFIDRNMLALGKGTDE